MLENKVWSKIPFYIVIGFLVVGMLYLTYNYASYREAYKGRGVEISFMKAQMAGLQQNLNQLNEVARQYYTMAMQYRQTLERGIVIPEDTTVFLKKGTLIIPPTKPAEKKEQKL